MKQYQPSAAMKALVSALITAAVPWPVITSSGRGATTAQRNPATTPSSAVPAATARQATTPRRIPGRRARRPGGQEWHWLGHTPQQRT